MGKSGKEENKELGRMKKKTRQKLGRGRGAGDDTGRSDKEKNKRQIEFVSYG